MINQGVGRWDRDRRDAAAKRLKAINGMLASGCSTDAVMERFGLGEDGARRLVAEARADAERRGRT